MSGRAERVVLVSRDAMLAEALETLVEAPGEVNMVDWRADGLELALQHADAIVVDVPPSLHERTFAVIDGRFLGRLVVLLQEGEPAEALPPGPSRVVLYRPLQIGDLWAAVTGAADEAAAGSREEAAEPRAPVPMIGMSGRELEPVIGPGQVAPGMDAGTLDRLRRWRARAEPPPNAERAPTAERVPAAEPPAAAAPAGARAALAARGLPGWLAGLARPAVVVALAGAVALGAAGWRGHGGPDLLAGEVAATQAAGSLARGSGLLLPDPRVGPVGPLHALAAGAWLRVTGVDADTQTTLEAAVRAARTPSRVLLVGVVVLTVILSLLLMRVGPGSGAAAGPGPAPPHRSPPARAGRLGGAAAAGLLAAADPLLVRGGRVATGTALALLLALATLALAWAPRRPARPDPPGPIPPGDPPGVPRTPPAFGVPRTPPALLGAGACAGLALLASPLALPLLAVPVVAAVLERDRRPGGSGGPHERGGLRPPRAPRAGGRVGRVAHALVPLGLGVALRATLPLWVAGQGLDAERARQLLGGPPGRGSLPASLAASPLSWLLAAAGLAAAIRAWRARPRAARSAGPPAPRSATPPRDPRLLAWVATTGAGALLAVVLGWPVEQALPFALPAAAAAVGVALARLWRARTADRPSLPQAPSAALAERRRELVAGRVAVAVTVAVGCLVLAQGLDWAGRYGGPADDGLGRLAAVVHNRLPDCSAVNAAGPDDRARLQAAGVNVTGFSSGPAAQAAGVRYFVLTGGTAAWRGGRTPPELARWVRQHGRPLADLPSRSLSRVQLWHVDAAPLDPAADSLAVPGGAFSNVQGSACGGYRVLDSDLGTFHTAYRALGGKAVLGRPLCSVWTSDGPALQAFDTMALGAVPNAAGKRPSVRPVDLPLLLAKLDPGAVAAAGIPRPSAPPPTTTTGVRMLLTQPPIARAYLGVDPATATPDDWRRAGERFGRPLGVPSVLPDGAVRQPFERVVIELPPGGGPARLVPLGQLALRVGLVPERARRLEPVPGLPAHSPPTEVNPGPLLWLLAGGLGLLALAGAAGVAAGRARAARRPSPLPGD